MSLFLESPVVAPGSSPEPGDNESELTSMTDLDISGDEMSLDGDSTADSSDSEQTHETTRSEDSLIRWRHVVNVWR